MRKEQLEKALEVAKVALSDMSGADNRAYTGKRVQEAFADIDAILNPCEEVPVERWTYGMGGMTWPTEESAKAAAGSASVYKLSGVDRQPLPRPVERSVEIEARIDRSGTPRFRLDYSAMVFRDHPELHGKRVTLTATWVEEGK